MKTYNRNKWKYYITEANENTYFSLSVRVSFLDGHDDNLQVTQLLIQFSVNIQASAKELAYQNSIQPG